jgi:hypothetical protein
MQRSVSGRTLDLFAKLTGHAPVMYGPTIIGFGSYHYRYESGYEDDAPLAAFSPRKHAIVLYLAVFDGREKLLDVLGKHTSGKSCIYIKRLSDIDIDVLAKLTASSVAYVRGQYG